MSSYNRLLLEVAVSVVALLGDSYMKNRMYLDEKSNKMSPSERSKLLDVNNHLSNRMSSLIDALESRGVEVPTFIRQLRRG